MSEGAQGAGREFAPVSGGASKGRVLLLEDDPSLNEIIRDCLAENGYSVVAVQNGGEGVREVLDHDFLMVFCDFRMPGLPGDMFYRAVKRIRPALCDGFVFMTGHQDDEKTANFIKSINGFVLRKPFPLQNLLDSIALAEVRRTFQSVVADVSDESEKSPLSASLVDLPTGENPPRRATSAVKIFTSGRCVPQSAPSFAAGSVVMAPERPRVVLVSNAPEARPDHVARVILLVGLGLLLAMAGGLWNQYLDARKRVTTASANRLARQWEWAGLAREVNNTVTVRWKNNTQLAWLAAERNNARWSPIFRGVLPLPGSDIGILDIGAHSEKKDARPREVRIRGIATGSNPRMRADRYRQGVEEKLKKTAYGQRVTARFEQLEDGSGALPEQAQATFVLLLSFGPEEQTKAAKKGGR